MAGSSGGEDDDNPVPMNVIPMVDVIFCLCVFFMCSFKFKQLEGKFDSWLPRNKGMTGTPTEIQEIRVILFWDEANQRVKRTLGYRPVDDDGELRELIRGAYEDHKARGRPDTPVIVDGDSKVPWREVVKVVNIAKGLKIDAIEFALGQKDKS